MTTAPAAAQTIRQYFEDIMTNQDNYDLILTGDLSLVGSELLYELLERAGYDIRKKHSDCGLMIYDRETQEVNAGAAGIAAAMFFGLVAALIFKPKDKA